MCVVCRGRWCGTQLIVRHHLVAAGTLWCRQMVGRRAVARQTVGANLYWTGLLTKVSGADTASVTAVYDFG